MVKIMEEFNYICRKAKINDDINLIAKYIFQTDKYIYSSICETFNAQEWIDLIKQCFTDKSNIFYYDNIMVLEIDGTIKGLLCYIQGGVSYNFSDNKIIDKTIEDNVIIVEKGYFQPLFVENISFKGYNMTNICIDEKVRGCGLGTILLDYFINSFMSSQLILDVIKENENAIKLYNKRGFQIIREYKGFAGADKTIDCYQMIKK